MRKKMRKVASLLSSLIICGVLFGTVNTVTFAQQFQGIRIFGLVNRPINFTDAELLSLPMVSEATRLECVWGSPNVTYVWTGVPIFHLLTMSQIRPEAGRVVFRARFPDSFFSSLNISEALKPTTLLGLMVNGTLLSEVSIGGNSGFRIVAPCKWGYKWVANVGDIEVVDSNYTTKGTYEDSGFSDDADMPNCNPPSINPPLQVLSEQFGNRTFEVEAFTNASLALFDFDPLARQVRINVTVSSGSTGFVTFILKQDMLSGSYSFLLDNSSINVVEANVTGRFFEYMALPSGSHSLGMVGSEFLGKLPMIVFEPVKQLIYVGETVILNASGSVDEGMIVSYEWDFGDGSGGTGAVVSHAYSHEGTYRVVLNVTDDSGFSSIGILNIIVGKIPSVPFNFLPFLRIATIVTIIAFSVVLAILLFTRRKFEKSHLNVRCSDTF